MSTTRELRALLDSHGVEVRLHKPVTKAELARENAELRELVLFANKTVEGLCEMVENSPGCFMCPLNQNEDRACGAAELYDRILKFGIGVEG